MSFQKIAIICILLFSISGLLKWIGLSFDPTIVFGVSTLMLVFIYLFTFNINSLGDFKIPFLLFITFHLFYFITSVYSLSNTYYIDKIFRVGLNTVAFIAPIVIIRDYNDFLFLKKIVLLFFISALILVTNNWFSNGLEIFYLESYEMFAKIPNYMSVSYFLGTCLLFFYDRKSNFYNFLKILSVLFIILLASKGVLLFLALIFLFEFKKVKIFKSENIKFIVPLVLIFSVYMLFSDQNIFENISNRVFLGVNAQEDQSSLTRLKYIDEALNIISNHPFLGIGIGAFGTSVLNIDERLSPHNVPLEIFLETGFIGFLFFCFVFYSFYKAFKRSLVSIKEKSEHLSYLYPLVLIFLGDLVSGIIEDSRLNYFWLGLAVSFYSYQSRMNTINNK